MSVQPIRILVAEDDSHFRDALDVLVRSEPTLELVAAVADAHAAVEAAAQHQPDVALVDVRMPGGGAAAARGILRVAPGTAVLALSAYDDRATVFELLQAGAVGYLVKGMANDAVVESIHQAARGQGSLSVEVTGKVIKELVGQLDVRRRAARRRLLRVKRIRRALDDDALSIVFQPICDLADGEPVGAEALSRFRAPPARGSGAWFWEAEEVGLGRELELAAAGAALAEFAKLPSSVYLSLNVSPRTLGTPRLEELLQGVDGERVVVEVTEHARIDDYEQVGDAIARVRSLGVRLAVDDAGAGFASLRHILRLEPDFIKLDRTLIEGIDHDRSRQALAAGLISFAERMGATIVAEGIERLVELEALAGLGVSYGQGFFLARPAPLPLGTGRTAVLARAAVG